MRNYRPFLFNLYLLYLAVAAILGSVKHCRADVFDVDQSQNVFSFSYTLSDDPRINSAPLGQTFRPTATRLNAVALYLADADSSRSNGTTVRVQLRSGSLTGSLLATSKSFFVPNNFQLNPAPAAPGGLVRFDFVSDVLLIPEATYVVEVVRESGDDLWVAAMGGNPYSRGEALVSGVPQTGGDLAFQTGIVTVPEPASVALLSGTLITCFVFKVTRRRSRY